MSDADARARALARRLWPGQVTDLAHARAARPAPSTTPAERIAMVWRITLDAWALSGRAWPTYQRANMPGRVIRPGDTRDDDD